jgi:hypothetical protein
MGVLDQDQRVVDAAALAIGNQLLLQIPDFAVVAQPKIDEASRLRRG